MRLIMLYANGRKRLTPHHIVPHEFDLPIPLLLPNAAANQVFSMRGRLSILDEWQGYLLTHRAFLDTPTYPPCNPTKRVSTHQLKRWLIRHRHDASSAQSKSARAHNLLT